MERMPFLRDKVLNKGRFGVSHTRVPTESRPGHVAIIAGFYEDVSAVTKGWKTNPVEFDSVFNESRHTFGFGSPDILPMFAYGLKRPHSMDMFMYEAESEDFAKDDASKLDTWVFREFEQLLIKSESNATLSQLLHSDQIVFFLHLLGVDTNGHAHRPHSKEYLENIQLADKGLAKVELLLDKFYNRDGKTAYIVTSDHGMGNRGSHGDGHPDNTQTPLVAWGAGISRPNHVKPTGHDSLSSNWNLFDVERNDVHQADIAPLMSSLIGIPFPMNSVGVLPLEYLDGSLKYETDLAFGNAKTILSQFLIKASLKKQTEVVFKPFGPLISHPKMLKDIETLIALNSFEEAQKKSFVLIDLALQGLRYYQIYDWLFLRSVVSLGYIGWILYSSLSILKSYIKMSVAPSVLTAKRAQLIQNSAIVVLIGTFALLFFKKSPFAYYFYVSFPIYFWAECFKERDWIVGAIQHFSSPKRSRKRVSPLAILVPVLGYILALEALVYSYFERRILTLIFNLIGWIWPLFFPIEFQRKHSKLIWAWRISCSLTSLFTLFSVELEQNVHLIMFGGLAVLGLGLVGILWIPVYTGSLPTNTAMRSSPRNKILAKVQDSTWIFASIQLGVIFASMILVKDTTRSLALKQGLPLFNSICSWLITGYSLALPVIDRVRPSQHYLKRLLVIFLSFAPLFILLAVSYEVLFYASFSVTLLLWMLVEKELYSFIHSEPSVTDVLGNEERKRSFELSDLRRAAFFLVCINMAFFGTGNIASVSSFSVESVYRFTTVFNPFLMASLLILKILVPFFITSATIALLSRLVDLPSFSLFAIIVSTTDIMTLNFFYLVRDDGSWLEIGTTISHFIIASAFIVFQMILFTVSHGLVGNVLIPRSKKRD